MTRELPQWVARVVVAVLVIVLIILGWSLWRHYRSIERSNLISVERLHLTDIRSRGPLTAADISSIDTWMTFDYVSVAFGVPTSTLQTALGITDPRYPHISLSRYARSADLDPNAFVEQVRNAVGEYIASSTTSSTAGKP